jgi:hypothetical protein
MSLFDMFRRKPKEEAPEAVAKPKTTLRVWETVVPAGFVLPEGKTVKDAFPITIEAGIRWHPEWEEPRVTVNVIRYLPMGDSLMWSGDKALTYQSLLDADVVALATYHGEAVEVDGTEARNNRVATLLSRLNVEAPVWPQPLSAFYTRKYAD